jgi:glycolate oxidase iron-sulfur subunit
MTLHLDDDELVACVACGLCLPHCPTYRVTGLEIASPRGRITAMRAVQYEGAPIDAAFVGAMEECVQCRGCEAACPSGVSFGHLMEETRAVLHDTPATRPSSTRRAVEWLGYRLVLQNRALLRVLSWFLWLGQRLRLVPHRFGLPTLRARDLTIRLDADPDPDAILFTGCVMDAWQRTVHRSALTVMRATGARVAPSKKASATCCGALHLHAGRVDEARGLARRIIASMPGAEAVVVDSAGCGATMKAYGRLVGTPEAEEFSARVRDFSEWVVGRGLPPLRATGRAVVVQDPCHLRHVQRAEQPVHQALASAYDVSTPGDDGLCCGAGGAYATLQPTLAGAIRDRKVEAIRSVAGVPTGSVLVASANPGCAMHLGAVAGLEVRHPAELIEEALEP